MYKKLMVGLITIILLSPSLAAFHLDITVQLPNQTTRQIKFLLHPRQKYQYSFDLITPCLLTNSNPQWMLLESAFWKIIFSRYNKPTTSIVMSKKTETEFARCLRSHILEILATPTMAEDEYLLSQAMNGLDLG